MNKKRSVRAALRWTATVILSGVIVYCGLQIGDILDNYRQEAVLHGELLAYRPVAEGGAFNVADAANARPGQGTREASDTSAQPLYQQQSLLRREETLRPNQSILNLRERNAAVVGWISVPGTEIEYPFVQAQDNSHYLSRNIDGKAAAAGTVFLDYRCSPQFLGFNHYLYGHHMKNGSMFGTLDAFDSQSFFDEHPSAMLYLDYHTYSLEIFAYMVVTGNNAMIYDTLTADETTQEAYFNYVKANARRCRDIDLSPGDRVVTLSTCAYEFSDARMVVLARIADSR